MIFFEENIKTIKEEEAKKLMSGEKMKKMIVKKVVLELQKILLIVPPL